MTDLLSLEYVEIDLPYCSLTYGNSPCQASLTASPPTGTIKCFNTRATCQDLVNIDIVPTTVRFCRQADYLPRDIDALPYLEAVDYSPAIVSLGENLGQRAELRFTLGDHPHSDTGAGFDKYAAERGYDPYDLGTIFGRLRSRYPSLRGVAVRWILGFVGQTLAQMETRHFFIESFNGPSADGKFSVVAKDVLKFLDGDRAVAPLPSPGFLVADISDVETSATLSPAGALASYPTTGYAAIGGNEIVEYVKDEAAGITANTKLLLHFDGADGSTTFTDSSGTGKTMTAVGNAQLDTDDKKYGTAALLLDGTSDSITTPDHADWTPAGDFTIDCWMKVNNVTTSQNIAVHLQDGNNFWQFLLFSNNTLEFLSFAGGVQVIDLVSATGIFEVGVWTHVALVRSGNVWTIYKNGVSVATTTLALSLTNFAGVLRIGASAATGASVNGWIEEFSFHHAARWTAAFIPPGPYSSSTSTDRVAIRRAQLNTEAASHGAQDRFQEVLRYVAQSPADIISDLITNYTDVPAGYVPLAEWQLECNTYLNRVYSFNIAEPTPVASLVSEIVVQAALALWDNDLEEQIHLQVLRGIALDVEKYEEMNIRAGSFKNDDQPEKRVSQVLVYYGQIDPTKPLTDDDNYRSTAHVTDDQAEIDYGVAIRKIHARGIAPAGLTVAERLAHLVLSRYRVAPRKFSLELLRESVGDPILGAGKNIEYWNLQDPTGAAETVPTQIIRLKPGPALFAVDLEEMRFDASESDLANRQITISSNTNNVNLRTVHDSLYPPVVGGASPAEMVTCTIAADVIVGSASSSLPAFEIGSWPAGVDIALIVVGRIEGHGGNGGAGQTLNPAGAGQVGGGALYTRYAITLTDTNGEIWGGGGGGGGGSAVGGQSGGGGGGAGQVPGVGGTGFASPGTGNNGADATTEAAGAGGVAPGASNDGGAGGGPGLAGTAGQGGTGGAGGTAGLAIDGISFVTTSGGAGDRRGGTAN